jgi:prepilin-type N-terminal cleavage/methylation domain-containing protein
MTLMEVIVTLVIVGILTGIAGVSVWTLINNGYNSSAEHTAMLAAAEAQSYYQEWGYFPAASDLSARLTGLTVVDGSTASGASTTPSIVSVRAYTTSEDLYSVAVLSTSGTCFIDTVAAPGSATVDTHTTTTAQNCWAGTTSSSGSW